ncbi:MAG: peptide deformylase [Nodosilinea sp.]
MTLPQPSQPCQPEPQTSLLTLGHPVLHQRAEPVQSVDDWPLQRLINQLLETMRAAHGVGIAAPQLGQALRVLVVASRPNLRYPQAPLMEPVVMINPRLVSASDDLEMGWEGCLSVPGVRGRVPRHRAVEVEYRDRHGRLQQREWEGFVARIFQHEADHLEGRVFLDRVQSETDLLSEQVYQTIEIGDMP